ncbi:MAG: glycine oxidase, partial [Solirubrobacteraceae bacterium]|nr:glycine oxidase [Solirubrobacteraceae bacterium]
AGGEVARDDIAAITTERDRVTGVSPRHSTDVAAGAVVLAAGAWSGQIAGLPPELTPQVRPVKGQLLHLRTRPGAAPIAERIVRTPRCYVVPRPDGRVIVGATSEERGYDTSVDAGAIHRLLEAAWEVLPDVWELEFERALAGLRPGTPDNRPLIGPTAIEGLVLATGHYRNGILLAPVTADLVAAELANEGVDHGFGPQRFATAAEVGS